MLTESKTKSTCALRAIWSPGTHAWSSKIDGALIEGSAPFGAFCAGAKKKHVISSARWAGNGYWSLEVEE